GKCGRIGTPGDLLLARPERRYAPASRMSGSGGWRGTRVADVSTPTTGLDQALTELTTELPGAVVTTDPAVVEKYRSDWSRSPATGTPLAVVRATEAAQVQELMRWATRHRVPVVPRGAGT